ncbi:MAG: peptide ABC transporter substrate-binding protein [Gammaproteobacteria bacterium]|nr:peptide ABC transporter substrate-binding protein [Gammaproteobacteria bacterium]
MLSCAVGQYRVSRIANSRNNRCIRRILAALSALLALQFSSAATAQNTLHLGNAGEPETLDPHRYNLRLEETILTDLFMGLTTFNARGETIPGVAKSWRVSDDGLVWTFELQPNLTWSDGEPLTAHDFVYAFRRLLAPETAASLAYFMYPLSNAEQVNAGSLPATALGALALDPHRLRLTLHKPYPHLPERLLYPTGYPVPAHVINKVGDAWVKPDHWVSNGAYVLADWQPQAHVELRRNPRFATPGSIETVFYHPLANAQSAYNRYRNKEMHAIGNFPAGELPTVRKNFADQLRLSPLLSMSYLVFNTGARPFDDLRVRAALALVIDSELLTTRIQRSGNVASESFVPNLVTGYVPVSMPHANLDMNTRTKRARALLSEAGYHSGNPLNITLRYISGLESKKTNLAIAAFWQTIGVETQLHHSELKVHFADLRQADFQVAQAGWFGENNAEHYLGLLVSDTGNVNYGRYANPDYDSLIAQAEGIAEITARNVILRQAESLAIAEYPVVPLNTVMIRRLVRPEIQGWYDNRRDTHPVRFLHWNETFTE